MPRFDVDGRGTVIELPRREFLSLIQKLVDYYYGLAEGYLGSHACGLAGFKGTYFTPLMTLIQKQVETIEPEIDDAELRDIFHSFVWYLQRLSEIDEQIVRAYAELYGFPSVLGQQDRIKLERRVKKQRVEFVKRPMPTTLQSLAAESTSLIPGIQETRQRIERKIRQLLETSGTEAVQPQWPIPSTIKFPKGSPRLADWTTRGQEADVKLGDQRAKDLIDEAEEEFDPKSAIRLLHRALRFGHTGIQASKAYQGLAMRYEDLGHKARAIKYYTKAMEAGGPSAIILFWRGQLYYQRGQLAEARSDFEQALAFPPGDGLVSPERELAEKYLIELNKPPEKR